MDHNDKLKIEAIKLAVGTTSYIGFSISGIYEAAIERLIQYYRETNESVYLEAALLHVHAYMEMGYEYDDKKELFDFILEHLGIERYTEFPRAYYTSTKVKLNKGQIKRMIPRWPASKQRMGINELVEDIIYKVKNKEQGIHYYNSNPEPDNPKSSGDLYELVIGETETYFHDIKRRRYFTFEE